MGNERDLFRFETIPYQIEVRLSLHAAERLNDRLLRGAAGSYSEVVMMMRRMKDAIVCEHRPENNNYILRFEQFNLIMPLARVDEKKFDATTAHFSARYWKQTKNKKVEVTYSGAVDESIRLWLSNLP